MIGEGVQEGGLARGVDLAHHRPRQGGRIALPRWSGWAQTPLSSVKPSTRSRRPAMATSSPSCFTPMKGPSSRVLERKGPGRVRVARASMAGASAGVRVSKAITGALPGVSATEVICTRPMRRSTAIPSGRTSAIGPSACSIRPAPGCRRASSVRRARLSREASAADRKTPTSRSMRTARASESGVVNDDSRVVRLFQTARSRGWLMARLLTLGMRGRNRSL